jgi:hypothetical protein
MKRQPKLKTLRKKAWTAFSRYIRLQAANRDGNVECVTCREWFPLERIQAGHFIDGRNLSILFSEQCCHPQCYVCNCIKHGNKVEYYEYMLDRYGKDVIDKLRILGRQTYAGNSRELYERIINLYGG